MNFSIIGFTAALEHACRDRRTGIRATTKLGGTAGQ